MTAMLELRDIRKHSNHRPLLDGVSLCVAAGETVAGIQSLVPTRIVSDWRMASEGLAGALQIERNVMRLIL